MFERSEGVCVSSYSEGESRGHYISIGSDNGHIFENDSVLTLNDLP